MEYDDDVICVPQGLRFSIGSWLETNSDEEEDDVTFVPPKPKNTINPQLHEQIEHLKPRYYWPDKNKISIDLSAPKVLKWCPNIIKKEEHIPAPKIKAGDLITIYGLQGYGTVRQLKPSYFTVSIICVATRGWSGETCLKRYNVKLGYHEYPEAWRRYDGCFSKPKAEPASRSHWGGYYDRDNDTSYADTETSEYTGPYKHKKSYKFPYSAPAGDGDGYRGYGGDGDGDSGYRVLEPQGPRRKFIGYSTRENRYKFSGSNTNQEKAENATPQNLEEYLSMNQKYNITLKQLLSMNDHGKNTASNMKTTLHDGFLVIDLNSKFPEVPVISSQELQKYKKKFRVRTRVKKNVDGQEGKQAGVHKEEEEEGEGEGEGEGEWGEEEEEWHEEIAEVPVVREIESLVEPIEIGPTQSIAELLEIYGGSSISPEDIFNPKTKKIPRTKKKHEVHVAPVHPEPLSPEELYPIIDTEAAKTNIFFDEIDNSTAENFYYSDVNNQSDIYFRPETVPESSNIFMTEVVDTTPRGFILVDI
eukprot:TRINITY_DN1018_c2_g1_i1.p1 TRINITY_DN1018_c2_g1~~TRINITY_DN1018_c2_g1_i1.p1  ORF type:complete len:530 (-),score=122.02 TRINITY_DN1018_c2_g1_i1:7-1596(-)